jgi:dolichol-phosphate mannosyltransferase
MTVIYVLPAYNEGENLAPLLDEVRTAMETAHLSYQVVVVDDGSKDNTYAVARDYARRMPVVIEQNMPNEGLASALRKGFRKACEIAGPQDVLVTMDADNTHKPAQVPQLLTALERGADIVVASRYRPGAEIHGLSQFRELLSRCAGIVFQICCPVRGVRDYTCGYRAYRAGLVQRGLKLYGAEFVSETGFSCIVDTLLKLNKMGGRATEIPLVLRYDLKKGQSKMRVVKTTFQTLWLLLRRRLDVGIRRG